MGAVFPQVIQPEILLATLAAADQEPSTVSSVLDQAIVLEPSNTKQP